MDMHRHAAPDAWIAQIFAAKAAMTGGVIRRNRQWVETEIGWDRFVTEVRLRGFHLLETGHQLIVVCHRGHIHMHF
jgi:hypothetical protein